MKFGIPDQNIARTLGLEKQSHAPIAIVGLLPDAPAMLNTKEVLRSFDTVPVPENAGQYPSSTTAAPK